MDFCYKLDCYITISDSAAGTETIKHLHTLTRALPLVRGRPYRVEQQLVELYIHLAYLLYYDTLGFYTHFSSHTH
jgi:hypothetical protein